MPRHRERREKLKVRLSQLPYEKHGLPRAFTVRLQPADSTYLEDRIEYTYKFRPARPQQDLVLRQIRDAIAKLNQDPDHGMLMCNHNIQVFPSTGSPPTWPPKFINNDDIKFYTFCQDMQEFPATVPVSVIPREGPLNVERLSMFALTRSTSSITYFWHKRGAKHFRLMGLSVELRLMIFERMIAPSGEIYPLNKAFLSAGHRTLIAQSTHEYSYITLGSGYRKEDITGYCHTASMYEPAPWALEYREPVPPPSLNLLYVSKQVKEEALCIGWEYSKRCFISPYMFTSVADSKIGVAKRLDVLGRIQLSFTVRSWFKFFGVEAVPVFNQNLSASLGYYLGELKDTCNLEIRFRDPEDGYNGDPWGDNTGATTCQTIIVDWILTWAFEHVKYIKYISLTGCVKKPQKEKWLEVLARQRADGDFDFDHATAVAAILATPPELLPPRCICRKNCQCFREDLWYWSTAWDGCGEKRLLGGSNFDFEDGREEEEEEVKLPSAPLEWEELTFMPHVDVNSQDGDW